MIYPSILIQYEESVSMHQYDNQAIEKDEKRERNRENKPNELSKLISQLVN